MDRRALATAGLTAAALVAFASNSILCRLALGARKIDALTFTNVRLLSGAAALAAIVLATRRAVPAERGSWLSALALFLYAAPFSLAYVSLPAGIGALILFGAVQTTMIGWGLWRGERPRLLELVGLALALCGLAGLALPGASAPEPSAAGCMAVAGVAWGVYSLRGRGAADPLASTAGNFARTVLFCAPLALFAHARVDASPDGVELAVASGALASGVGYAIWYRALRGLTATRAAIVQLLVPVLAAAAGVVVLNERVSVRLVLGGTVMLAGVLLAVLRAQRR